MDFFIGYLCGLGLGWAAACFITRRRIERVLREYARDQP